MSPPELANDVPLDVLGLVTFLREKQRGGTTAPIPRHEPAPEHEHELLAHLFAMRSTLNRAIDAYITNGDIERLRAFVERANQ